MLPGGLGQNTHDLLNAEFDEFFAIQAEEVAVRHLRDTIIAREAVADIDFFRQPDLTDQFQIAPDSTVPNRAIFVPHLLVQLIDRHVLTQLEKGAEDQLPLGGHLEAFGSEELSHILTSSAHNRHLKTIFNFN